MRDLTIQDIRKVAQGRYMRKHRGKIAIVAFSMIAWMILWVIVWSCYVNGHRGIEGYVATNDVWYWLFSVFLWSSLIAYVVLAVVFGYLESRFMWKFQQQWSDNNKMIPEDYRS
jgi:hypothetical protein